MQYLFSTLLLIAFLSGCGATDSGSSNSVENNTTKPDDNTTIPPDINNSETNNTKPVEQDTLAPTILLIGDANISIDLNTTYLELGATAFDEVDGTIDVEISGKVDLSKAGEYLLIYKAEDGSGNISTVTRTVYVKAKEECNTYSENVISGRELYIEHCKVCHASDAKSGNFDIRGALVSDITYAMGEVPNMIELNLAEKVPLAQRELISDFLIAIKDDPDVKYGNQCDKLTMESLGERLFFDNNLSLRKNTSCSSCHNPGYGFSDGRFHLKGDPNPVKGALSLGDDNISLGGRNAPTASYAQFFPAFGKNAAGEYMGGQFHDGRAATLKDQAKGPFLDPSEMMMPDAATVIERVIENDAYVGDFKELFGESVFDNTAAAYDAVATSIAKFEKTATFAPFDSKYDRSKLHPTDSNYYAMTNEEQNGYKLFFDTNRTNCAICHTINSATEGPNEIFTNFKYENIGTPRNLQALITRDGNTDTIDLGLGGRSDINDSSHYGKIKVPTLRNIAVTDPYMSNGVFKNLSTVLAFYNHMSGEDNTTLNPETNTSWSSPEINTTVNRKDLKMKLLNEEELRALEAFLKLLTDKRYESLLNK